MFKSAIFGALIVTGLTIAAAAPAQARHANFSVQFNTGYTSPNVNVRSNGYRSGVSPRQIRRTVRNYGCYDISRVRRDYDRYKVKATCDYGQRVKMVFSARSGRLLRERVIGHQPRYRQFSQFRPYRNRRH
ncbi:MAG: hypothetical protein ACC634_06565 [Hyphomicrobiales bacterium]